MAKQEFKNPYNVSEMKRHLATLPDLNAKLNYVNEIKTNYLQGGQLARLTYGAGAGLFALPFDQICDLEIERIKQLQKATISEQMNIAGDEQVKFNFKLSKRKGAKTDLIRVLNALYELRFFVSETDLVPPKKDFMKAIGQALGENFDRFDKILSQSKLEQDIEVTYKIFEEMKDFYSKNHREKNM